MRGVSLLGGVETQVKQQFYPSNFQARFASLPRDPKRTLSAVDAPRPLHYYGVHNNSLNNLKRGLLERVFAIDAQGTLPPRPTASFDERLKPFSKAFRPFRVEPFTMNEFVERYSGRQYTRYSKAMEDVLLTPVTARDARVSTFVKAEKIDFSKKVDPAPRVIQPRDPRFNVAIGQFIAPLEHKAYKALGALYKYPAVAKGYNAYQTGDICAKKWNLFKEPTVVGLDASRFDQHVSQQALRWTHSQYLRFVNDPEFKRLLNMMLVNKGFATAKDGCVKYKIDRGRMSGDMDTALGNCLLMVAMVYSYCASKGIRHECFDNGDDVIVFMEKTSLALFMDGLEVWFRELGFTMKVESPVFCLEHVEFCQTHPVYDGVEWRMVRNLGALAKDLCCVSSPEEFSKWIYAVGECGLALTDGIPVFTEFYHWMLRYGEGSDIAKRHDFKGMGMYRLARGMEFCGKVITDDARLSFFRAFGLTPDQQLDLESMYQRLGTPLGKKHEEIRSLNRPELFWQHGMDLRTGDRCVSVRSELQVSE